MTSPAHHRQLSHPRSPSRSPSVTRRADAVGTPASAAPSASPSLHDLSRSLAHVLQGTPYVGYVYAYPHKTAYRPFHAPIPLRDLWADERRDALFLYLHIPFCEMRCGFCNLFTTVDPAGRLTASYLAALRRQAEQAHDALGTATVARMALGGGTPTFLAAADLAAVFDLAEQFFGVDPWRVPSSVETSPQTATPDRLRLLRARGVDRISIGIQSFAEPEVRAVGREQRAAEVERALECVREVGFPTLNIDLIYGLPGQTVASWLGSLRAALRYAPEELFLYPLYVRPLTGLGRRASAQPDTADDLRLACYRAGRDLLLEAGYVQVSMRMFRAAHAPAEAGPVYCAQEDGMVGLGCGARSYTRTCHYAGEYAVGAGGVRAILAEYTAAPAASFAFAHYGFALDADEQRRRYTIQSLFDTGGLRLAAYRQRFATDALTDLPELPALLDADLATITNGLLTLTDSGVERSDAIGPWLYSPTVRDLMGGYQWR